MRRLAADYAYDFKGLESFFAGDPTDRAAWSRAISKAQAYARPRHDVAAIIARQQEAREAPPVARAAARRLQDPSSVAIVTGQQAGLFGGPMFTLLKALTAIRLAERTAREHQVPAAAVFWIEGEDHDWNEVRSCTVLDGSLTPRTVSLPPELMLEPGPVASVRLDDSVRVTIDEIERLLPQTAFKSSLLADLREIYAPGSGMSDAFARWMERALGAHGLVVYDASDPDAKPFVRDVFCKELEAPGETIKRAARTGADLAERGYHAQVQVHEDAVALFVLDGGRQPIRQQDGQFVVGGHIYSRGALMQEASEHPAGFSPSVLLRPIVQDTLFPTIAYVAGPNELSYLAQLGDVYRHFGVPMPLMVQRASATIVDAGAMRFLTRYEVPLQDLQAQDESVLNALLAAQIPAAVEAAFAAVTDAVSERMAVLTQAIPAVDPTLEGAAKSTLGKMQHDLETLHGKMIQAAKRRDETLRRQFQRTRALAFPNGHPQEREVNFISFLNQYGPALIDRLKDELPLEPGKHWVIAI